MAADEAPSEDGPSRAGASNATQLKVARAGWVRGAVFLSGGAALIYQTVWVRQTSLILGSTSAAAA